MVTSPDNEEEGSWPTPSPCTHAHMSPRPRAHLSLAADTHASR